MDNQCVSENALFEKQVPNHVISCEEEGEEAHSEHALDVEHVAVLSSN